MRRLLHAALSLLALVTIGSATAAAQSGTVTGQVTAQGGSETLQESRVIVLGTALYASSGPDGRYTIRNVPAGRYDLRVMRVGYVEQKRSVLVAAGQSVTADFTLEPAVVHLQEVVTTATGEQRRIELGSSVSSLDAASRTQSSPITDMASLLVAQSPGVQVMPGNTVGTGARIRIRGTSSLSLVNDPIYVIDGVRMRSDNGSMSGNIFTGGAVESRAMDINPDEIENIEIVKGPSAATLYGTDAANGVIVITTKRGRAGATKYNAFFESGVSKDLNNYPANYYLWGHAPAGSTRNCLNPALTLVSQGLCVSDSLSTLNLFTNSNTTPFTDGGRLSSGVNVSGGVDNLRFFASGQYDEETGILTIPKFDVQRFDTLNVPIKTEWKTPNAMSRASVRVNVDAALSPKLDAQFSTSFISQMTRLPQNDNDAYGLLSNAFGGVGYENGRTSTLGFNLHGYRQTTPGESFQDVSQQYIDRFIGSSSLNYRPLSWLSMRGNGGVDYTARDDQAFCARGTCADVGTVRLGFANDDRASIRTLSLDGAATATFNPRPWALSRSTLGVQWVFGSFNRNGAGAVNLTPGSSTVTGGATQAADAQSDNNKTLGVFFEEQLALRDRLFLTAAVRSDQNSAFGTNFQRVFYPKFSASYVISDEQWFPRVKWMDQLRLRTAYGASGVQPGSRDALQYYSPTTTNIALVDQPGVVYASAGNAVLRPERANEFEIGFDTKLWTNRINFEATYYNKLTKDAIIGAVVPPDLGSGNTTIRTNLGSVQNTGAEFAVNTQIMETSNFAWDATLNYSMNGNKLVTLGTDAQGRPIPPQVGTTTRQQAGYPLNGYWQKQITSFADKNGDHMITLDEIVVNDSATFVGYSIPRYEATLQNGFDLFKKRLRVSALFDYKGGYMQLNGTERIRCGSRNNCYGAYDAAAPLWQQARAVAVREHASRTQAGYMEDAHFVRFRELSFRYQLPDNLVTASRFAKGANITFSVRNLHKWTNYSGVDPESNSDAGSTASVASDFQALAPPTYYTLRLNLGF
jgi:TonB-linked SusC/RagA family outer membrane protein